MRNQIARLRAGPQRCLGKVIGGGMPLAAFGGKRAVMEQLAPLGPVYQAGTLVGQSGGDRVWARDAERNSPKPGFFDALAARTRGHWWTV